MLKILFLCTGNSCRSQMAEGWARRLKSDRIEPYSAGIQTNGLNPLAVRVMAEAGVDISNHRSKSLAEFQGIKFDYIVAVSDHAFRSCPERMNSTRVVRQSFENPPRLADDAKTEEEQLAPYRLVRDKIRAYIETLPDSLTQSE
jgi:arsenate reductase (thioredoxin)